MEGLITLKEATDYMKKCRADASPGSSGFTGGFYKLFLRNMKIFIVNSLNFAYESGNLSLSQKLGIIILLPKPQKDKKLLSNWRPITLLNHIYKILSGTLAERLKPALPQIIHGDQKGFVKGRFIGECVRNTYDVIEYAKNRKKTALLLLIDFEKAFDSISHSFIMKTLDYFGFGYSFMKWINLILNDLSSCINHCGNITDRFSVGRSCRQGDPISPYLFILCVEILALKIRKEPKVKGFKLGNYEQKIDIYADDLTAYLDGTEASLRAIIDILGDFHKISGLKINLGKCKAVWIGAKRFCKDKLCTEFKLIWSNNFSLLGVDFDSDLANMDTNFNKKMDDIQKLYNSWLYRHLSPFGRISVIKSLALSKLSHVVLVCPHIEPEVLGELTTMSFKFLWKNKPDRIKRVDAMLPLNLGGLNMPDIGTFWDSLKISWARRLLATDCVWQKILQLNLLYEGYDMKDILFGGPKFMKIAGESLSNIFWKETISAFSKLCQDLPAAHPHMFYHLNIFHNKLFSGRGIFIEKRDFPELWGKSAVQVGDFFNCQSSPPALLSLDDLNEKYQVRLNFLRYLRIKTSIEQAAKALKNKIFDPAKSDTKLPRLPIIFKISCLETKGCGTFYKTLRFKSLPTLSQDQTFILKWLNESGLRLSGAFVYKIWRNLKQSIISNKMKWVSIQINRYILPTNYTVNHYDKSVNPGCSLCSRTHPEKLHLLFWGCQVVQGFWKMIGNLLTQHFQNFKLDAKEAIFGDIGSDGDSIINTILFLARQFIYTQKFTTITLDEVSYIIYMQRELKFLYDIHAFKNEQRKFMLEWVCIFYCFDVFCEEGRPGDM